MITNSGRGLLESRDFLLPDSRAIVKDTFSRLFFAKISATTKKTYAQQKKSGAII